MSRVLGQFLRFLGLLIELVGFWALATRTGTDEAGAPLPGSYPTRIVWTVIGLGFATWLVGTVLNFWARASRVDSPRETGRYDIRL